MNHANDEWSIETRDSSRAIVVRNEGYQLARYAPTIAQLEALRFPESTVLEVLARMDNEWKVGCAQHELDRCGSTLVPDDMRAAIQSFTEDFKNAPLRRFPDPEFIYDDHYRIVGIRVAR